MLIVMPPTVTHADAMSFMVTWWMAVKQQYHRILPETPTYGLRGQSQVDAYLFVWSAHNLRTAAELVFTSVPHEVKPAVRQAVDEFDLAAPDIRKMRNAISHFDDYAFGRGALQARDADAAFGIYGAAIPGDFQLFVCLAPGAPRLELSVATTAAAADRLFQGVGRSVDHLPMPTFPGVSRP